MPILSIEIVGEFRPDASFAQRLADACAAVLASRVGGTWVKLAITPASHYAENGGLTESALPVFVSLLLAEPPSDIESRRNLATKLSETIGNRLGRPEENVHILFEMGASGRMFFGGSVTP